MSTNYRISSVFIFLAFIFNNALAQNKFIKIDYNDVHCGSNISICYKKEVNRLSYYVGLKAHLSVPYNPKYANNSFEKNFSAKNFSQVFGLRVGAEYKFYEKENYSIAAFYDLQFGVLTNRHISYYPFYIINKDSILYLNFNTTYTNPNKIIEHNIGLKLRAKLTKRTFLNLAWGYGIARIYNANDPKIVDNFRVTGDGLISIKSVGLEYKLNKN